MKEISGNQTMFFSLSLFFRFGFFTYLNKYFKVNLLFQIFFIFIYRLVTRKLIVSGAFGSRSIDLYNLMTKCSIITTSRFRMFFKIIYAITRFSELLFSFSFSWFLFSFSYNFVSYRNYIRFASFIIDREIHTAEKYVYNFKHLYQRSKH